MMMKLVGYAFLVTILCVTTVGCLSSPELIENEETLFQYSTLGSLLEGVYDGEMTYAELKRHGDFGLGTFNALDGEMIELDHQVYQIKANGAAYQVDGEMKTPFAVVTYFEPDQTVTIAERMDCEQLREYLDSLLPTENIPYALKIDGVFSYMKTRSVPKQNKPYPRLLDVLEEQSVFEFHEVEGVMVGFRLPSYMEGANAPGYHLHFITGDRDAGGHVLDCQPQDIKVEIDYTNGWYTLLPEDEEFYDVEMTGDEYQ
jgi:acetolactate decarboxylase